MIEPARIGGRVHGAGGDQRLDLGAEIEEVPLPRPEQRADADAIPREQHNAPRKIDQHESELTLEMGEQILAVLLVEMHDELGVAVGAKHVALGHKLGAPLREIEKFAIADDGNSPVLIEDRLMSVLQPENA